MTEITRIELSKSDRSRCHKCSEKIKKGTPRGVETDYRHTHVEYHYYCFKCVPDILREMVKRIESIKLDFYRKMSEIDINLLR